MNAQRLYSGRTRQERKLSRRRRIFIEQLEDRRLLATVTVNSVLDVNDGDTSSITALNSTPGPDGVISLREAVIASNSTPGGDEIVLPVGTYSLTIVGSGEDAAATGDLDILEELTIVGATGDAADVTIDATGLGDRVFDARMGSVSIQHVTIQGGDVGTDVGGGVRSMSDLALSNTTVTGNQAHDGAGVHHTAGTLLIQDSTLSGNTASGDGARGGGLYTYSSATATIEDSIFNGNQANSSTDFGQGGGIYTNNSTMNIRDSVISGNSTSAADDFAQGGGIYNVGDETTIERSTISGNSTVGDDFSQGGGLYHTGNLLTIRTSTISGNAVSGADDFIQGGGLYHTGIALTIENSTISGNMAGSTAGSFAQGGGLYHTGTTLTVRNTTITLNSAADEGGGIFISGFLSEARVATLTSTIIAGNSGVVGNDLFSEEEDPFDVDFSLIQDTSGATINDLGNNLFGVGPQLGSLQDNGGPTETHLPLTGSPVIDTGNNPATLTTGQRGSGFPRTFDFPGITNAGDGTDIGAVEVNVCSLIITTDLDVIDAGDGVNSLREAIICANLTPERDTITVPTGTYQLTTAGDFEDQAVTGDLDITADLTIVSATGDPLDVIIDGTINGSGSAPSDRVLHVHSVDVDISGVTIANGDVIGDGGGLLNEMGSVTMTNVVVDGNVASGFGGGLATFGAGEIVLSTLNLDNVVVSNNSSTSGGGGIFSDNDDVFINNSVIGPLNQSQGDGGGIFNLGNGTLTVTNTMITANSAGTERGGGIYNAAVAVITASTVSDNIADRGAGIYQTGSQTLTVTDSTLDGNSANKGGGILSNSGVVTIISSTISGNDGATQGGGLLNTGQTMSLTNTTVSGNTAGSGGGAGIFNRVPMTAVNVTVTDNTATGDADGILNDSTVELQNTIVANNGDVNCGGSAAITSIGNNLENADTCGFTSTGDLVNADPLLGPLQNNGGLTFTHALFVGSPAIDTGGNNLAVDDQGQPLTNDQRGIGFPRIVGGIVDIGALEADLRLPTVGIANAPPVIEGSTAIFDVTLSRPLEDGESVVVTYSTVNGSAMAPDDFTAVSGTLTFDFGDPITKTISVITIDDDVPENEEMFTVNITATGVSAVTSPSAIGTILDTPDLPVMIADLSLTKIVNSSRPNVGDFITFTLAVTNDGPDGATGVAVTDLLPAGLTFSESSPSQGIFNNATGIWNVGSLPLDQAAMLTITALVDAAAATTNTAQVTASDQFDPDSMPANNAGGEDDQAAVIVTPQVADLSVVKTVDDLSVVRGQNVTFTIELNNTGPDPATGVTVADLLPAGLQFVSAASNTGSYDSASGVWTVGELDADDTAALNIVATLTTSQSIDNTAQVATSDQFDPDSTPGNNVEDEDDQFSVNVGSCLSGGPLAAGTNRLIYSCVTPGGFAAFIVGTQFGSHFFNKYGVTVDIADPGVPAIGVGDINGVAEVLVEISEERAGHNLIFQAFEMLPDPKVSNALTSQSSGVRLGVPLHAAGVGFGGTPLSAESLPGLVSEAITRWQQIGLSTADLQTLRSLDVRISDLPRDQLASTHGNFLLLDTTAAGHGWFIDGTASDDAEYARDTTGTLVATTAAAIDRIDALTVLMHEMGHVLGKQDLVDAPSSELMLSELPLGLRRLPIDSAEWFDPLDVNRDGRVTALDALVVLNQLNKELNSDSYSSGEALTSFDQVVRDYDANRDGRVSALDALTIVEQLNRSLFSPTSDAERESRFDRAVTSVVMESTRSLDDELLSVLLADQVDALLETFA